MAWNRSDYLAAGMIIIIVAVAAFIGISMLGGGSPAGGYLPFK